MKQIEKYLGIALLFFAVGFTLWIYRAEPSALIDPNDNTFQFALVDRTNQIWSFAQQKCSGISKPFCVYSYLADHWVPNWAEGYNLPNYYSHVPQIAITASWRCISLFAPHYSLFTHYHWVIYFLLVLFPIAIFMALRIIGISWVTAGIGAIIATNISTDGLYGLDPASFLWRGYGLSSQLFAMIWLPLAIAYTWHYLASPNAKRLVPAILSLTAVTSGHLGVGIIAFISAGVFAISPSIQSILHKTWDKKSGKILLGALGNLVLVFAGVGVLLGYWILPILNESNYHNISVWDGIWKFDSFGYRDVLKNFFNGDLFDFGRLPILTGLTLLGVFIAAGNTYFGFAMLFVVWMLMYFGRTTWGGLFTLIPGMSEYHLSRFIVGVHVAGLFLIPVGIDWVQSHIAAIFKTQRHFTYAVAGLSMATIIAISVIPQTLRYATHNDFLIARGNAAYEKDSADIDGLIAALRANLERQPGRVFAGRGGSWGKRFRIAETPMYMHLSTYGIPVILWLPETWSPNSDTEQYFSENNPAHYSLYNVRYVATPIDLAPDQIQPFWKPLMTGKSWKLYEVATDGYITAGVRPTIVSATKTDYRSVVRLWMHSKAYTQGIFPELTFNNNYPKQAGLPNFRMIDEVTYKVPDGSVHNIFGEPPLYLPPGIATTQKFDGMKKTDYAGVMVNAQSEQGDMRFTASVTVSDHCVECIVVLKQSFHPSWKATIDGKKANTFAVFPFYTAVKLNNAGIHDIVFSYEPSVTKKALILLGLLSLGSIAWLTWKNRSK